MASRRQIEANRRNARRSTGPRTEEGLRASSLNSIRHGLRSKLTLIPGENLEEFQASWWERSPRFRPSLFDGIVRDAAPRSTRDFIAVRKIATAEWRLRRIVEIETGMLRKAIAGAGRSGEGPRDDAADALAKLRRAAAASKPGAAPPDSPIDSIACGFLSGVETHFHTILRYEATLDGQYNKAWRDLDSRPAPEPSSEPEDMPDEPGPEFEQPVWKSAMEQYAEAEPLAHRPDPDSGASPGIPHLQPPEDSTPQQSAQETTRANPIPFPDTSRSTVEQRGADRPDIGEDLRPAAENEKGDLPRSA